MRSLVVLYRPVQRSRYLRRDIRAKSFETGKGGRIKVDFRKIVVLEERVHFFPVCEVRDDVDSDCQAVSNPVNACEGVARSGSIVRQLKGIFSSPLCHPTCRFCLFVFPVPIVNRATAHFAARCPRQEVFRSDSRVFDATGESWKGKTVSRSPIGYRISDYAYANADCVKERSHFFS